MSVDIGIIGPQGSGKTTLFSALTGSGATTRDLHIGTAKVPDKRLGILAEMFHSKKITPAEVKYLDIGASVGELTQSGIGGKVLTELSKVDELLNVVRGFDHGAMDITEDMSKASLEIIFSDLSIIEKRLEKLGSSLKAAKADERQNLLREQEVLLKLKEGLEKDIPIRDMGIDEPRIISGYQFLSAKPMLTVVNISDEDVPRMADLEKELNARFGSPSHQIIAIPVKLEQELSELSAEFAQEMRSEYGLNEPGFDRIIRASYDLLGLITFLTTGPDDTRAWSIPRGTTALKAAGKIHSDIERGFIRAEVISFDELVSCGSLAEARKRGLLRLEGKDYVVREGDIINILFGV
jgi:hypothetical protein